MHAGAFQPQRHATARRVVQRRQTRASGRGNRPSSTQVDRVGVAHRAARTHASVGTPPSLRGRAHAVPRPHATWVASRVPPIAASHNLFTRRDHRRSRLPTATKKLFAERKRKAVRPWSPRRHLSTARSPSDGHRRAKKGDPNHRKSLRVPRPAPRGCRSRLPRGWRRRRCCRPPTAARVRPPPKGNASVITPPHHAALRHRLPTTATMASPSASPPANGGSGRRVPPPCWTPDETLALARAYTARRLAVGREHLTSADWAAVAAAAPSKTARQCRHKVEKLRRRLRSSRRRPCPLLDAIDLLDGPSPPRVTRAQSPSPSLSPPSPYSPPASPPRKRRRDDDDGVSNLVGALRAIGEGFLRAEERRMEAARETQRMRMDMALRHLDAQRQFMEAFVSRIVDALD
jgi:hypothetical protein